MSARNTLDSYGSVAKFFHWLIAALVIIMLLIGLSFEFIDYKPLKGVLMEIHKSTGLTILFLFLLRLCWRLINPTPRLPASVPSWQKMAARTSHFFLYLVVICMATSGWVMSTAAGYPPEFWWLFHISAPWVVKSKAIAEAAETTHLILAWTVTGFLVLHVLGALKHHLID